MATQVLVDSLADGTSKYLLIHGYYGGVYKERRKFKFKLDKQNTCSLQAYIYMYIVQKDHRVN